MIKPHPFIVHFPVALLLLAGLFGLISLFVKREFWKDITLKCLVVGVLLAPIAIFTGFIEEQNMQHGGVDETLMMHKYNGIALLFLFQILLAWFWLRKNIPGKKEYTSWVLCLLIGSSLVLLQGYLGGKLVFTKGMGVKPVEEKMSSGGHGSGSKGSDMKGMPGMDKKEGQKDMTGMTATDTAKKKMDMSNGSKKDTSEKKKELKDMKY